jgi:hypothetical protein
VVAEASTLEPPAVTICIASPQPPHDTSKFVAV